MFLSSGTGSRRILQCAPEDKDIPHGGYEERAHPDGIDRMWFQSGLAGPVYKEQRKKVSRVHCMASFKK